MAPSGGPESLVVDANTVSVQISHRAPRGRADSGWGRAPSGRPRIRSPMIVRWIWSVPQATEMPGTDGKSRRSSVQRRARPGQHAVRPAISACTRAACRAMTLLASLPSEPSGPGDRPAARAAAARSAVHRADQASSTSRAISWRTSGSPARPCAIARLVTRCFAGRPAAGTTCAARWPRSAPRSPPARPARPPRLFGAAAGPGRGETALVREDRQRDRPAAALLPDQVADRDSGLIQEHLVERGVPVHLPQRAHLDPRLAHRQHEAGDAAVLGHAGIGASQQQPEVRGRRSGRPDLLPRHQPLIAGRLGPGGQPGQVRARSWLAEQLAPGDLAGDGTPDEAFPERIGAVLDEHRPGQAHADPFGRTGHSRTGQLLPRQRGQAGSDRPHQPRGQAGQAHPASASNSRHRTRLSSGSQLASIHRRSSASTPTASGTAMVTAPRIGEAAAAPTRGCPRRSPPSAAAGPAPQFPVHRRPGPVRQRAAHRRPDRPHRERGADGDLGGQFLRGRPQAFGLRQPVGQPDPGRLLAADPAAGAQQVQRALLADDRGQRDRQREAMMQAEPGEVRAEPGLRAGDAEVGGAGQPEAATHRRALHGGDHRRPHLEQPGRRSVEFPRTAHPGPPRTAGEVRARAEVLAVRAQHRRAELRLLVQPRAGIRERGDELGIEEVVRRAPDLHHGHEVAARPDAHVTERCPRLRHDRIVIDIDVDQQEPARKGVAGGQGAVTDEAGGAQLAEGSGRSAKPTARAQMAVSVAAAVSGS